MAVTKLVLVRHGESQWNQENRFTGWYDVDLSDKGRTEAKAAGKLLKEEGFTFDFAYTSVLKRAIHTLWNILDELDQARLPTEKSRKLNERHYGALQGLNKAETAEKYGDEQVKQWRRGFAVTPPELTKEDERYRPRSALRLADRARAAADRKPGADHRSRDSLLGRRDPATHQERRARDRCGARQLAARTGEIPIT